MNPVLYPNKWVFNDIVNGLNTGCSAQGFHADKDWDPVTGLGTPDFERLMELYMRMP